MFDFLTKSVFGRRRVDLKQFRKKTTNNHKNVIMPYVSPDFDIQTHHELPGSFCIMLIVSFSI